MRYVCVCAFGCLLRVRCWQKLAFFKGSSFPLTPAQHPLPPGQWFQIRKHFYRNCLAHVNGKETYRHVDELTHGHADTYSCRRIDTQTGTHAHAHTHTQTHAFPHSHSPTREISRSTCGTAPYFFVGLFCTGGDFKSDFKSYRAILKPNKNRVLSQGARAQKPCNNALLQKKPVAMLSCKRALQKIMQEFFIKIFTSIRISDVCLFCD